MSPVLKSSRWSLRRWISNHPMIAIGTFMSTTFLFLGLIGTVLFLPRVRNWHAAADWPTAEAKILSGRLQYARRGARPEFTYTYEWMGQNYTASGYDLIGAYVSGTSSNAHATLDAYPVGSRVTVLVNPEQPGQAVISRGSTGGVILLFVPPLFSMLGLAGMSFTAMAALGWLDENTQNPLGRALRAGGAWFIQEKIARPFVYLLFGSIILGIAVLGVLDGSFMLIFIAAVFAWGVWRAARPQKRK